MSKKSTSNGPLTKNNQFNQTVISNKPNPRPNEDKRDPKPNMVQRRNSPIEGLITRDRFE